MTKRMWTALVAAPMLLTSACDDSARIVTTYQLIEGPGEQPVIPVGTAQVPPVDLKIDPAILVGNEGEPTLVTPKATPTTLPTDPHEWTPTPTKNTDGIPGPLPGVYQDLGYADATDGIRGLIGFPIRNNATLEQRIKDIYDPASPKFRDYMTPDEWNAQFAPYPQDVQMVQLFLENAGLKVDRVASNRLLLEFTGTVGQFNQAFGTQLKVLQRNSRFGNEPPVVLGLDSKINAPKFVTDRITTIVSVDLPPDPGPAQPEAGFYSMAPPANIQDALTPAQLARAYNVDTLYQQGFKGQGVKLGVVVGSAIRLTDLKAFWDQFGVSRALPTVVETMEPPPVRLLESQVDVAWSGALAPLADMIVYTGPDPKNTSVVYTFNEAIARGEVDVLTDSFAHREDAEPTGVAAAYNAAAKEAAAIGMTVMSPSGDSAQPDVPSSSPYVTAVGGTRLRMNGMSFYDEIAWYASGSGLSDRFTTPYFQQGLNQSELNGRRAVADVALNAETYYWTLFLKKHEKWGGTSFASPVFAGIMATVNSGRVQQGKPMVGWLNPQLYMNSTVHGAFRDITFGMTDENLSARTGWDMPTGWGAPKADLLLQRLP